MKYYSAVNRNGTAACRASDDSEKSDMRKDFLPVFIPFIQNPRKEQSHGWGQTLDSGSRGWGWRLA